MIGTRLSHTTASDCRLSPRRDSKQTNRKDMVNWRGATTIGIGRNLCGLCDKITPQSELAPRPKWLHDAFFGEGSVVGAGGVDDEVVEQADLEPRRKVFEFLGRRNVRIARRKVAGRMIVRDDD